MEELEENGFRFRMETAAYFEDGRIKNVYLEGEMAVLPSTSCRNNAN